jgi:NAD(P)-dependent dehydrogenase (short-subunit alcohol dehydrogenase family)
VAADGFDLTGKVAVLTGGTGVLGSCAAHYLAAQGMKIALLSQRLEKAQAVVDLIAGKGGQALALEGNVLNRESLLAARETVLSAYGQVDALINYAGGNHPEATTNPDNRSLFEVTEAGLDAVFALNLKGTILPSQTFGECMVKAKEGVILNISSMAAQKPLTRVLGYSAAKAAIDNFTRWLAVHMAQEYGPKIRVNALAPGFFLTEQNRFLLINKETGEATPRGKSIVDHTPMGRYGEPEELNGAIHWLLSPSARFVTGIVVPVDGGFSAFGGI